MADTPRLGAARPSGFIASTASAPSLPVTRLQGSVNSTGDIREVAMRETSRVSLVQEASRTQDGVEMSTVMSAASDEGRGKEQSSAASAGGSHVSGPQPQAASSLTIELLRGAHQHGLINSDGKPAWQPPLNGAFEFCGCLRDTLRMGRHALIARNFE